MLALREAVEAGELVRTARRSSSKSAALSTIISFVLFVGLATSRGEFLRELTDLGFEDFDCLGLVFDSWKGGFAGWAEHFRRGCVDGQRADVSQVSEKVGNAKTSITRSTFRNKESDNNITESTYE